VSATGTMAAGRVAVSAADVGRRNGILARLSSNEVPFGPSPRAISAAQELASQAWSYPDDSCSALRSALADFTGSPAEGIIVAAGSTPLLHDLVRLHAGPGDEVLVYEKSFRAYSVGTANARATLVAAPVGGPATVTTSGFARDVASLVERISAKTRMVIVDHPGNPTGAHLTGNELRELADQVPNDVLLLVDEAYFEFAVGHRGYETSQEAGIEHPRLAVVRTLSKAHSLAGLRIGYAMVPVDVAQAYEALRPRFNISAASQAAAIESLGDAEHLEANVRATLVGRQRIEQFFRDTGVPFTESLGNFVTFEVDREAKAVAKDFADLGVGVRPLPEFDMPRQVRVSVGKDEELEAFFAAAISVLGLGMTPTDAG